MFCIYKIRNKINGKIYIGQHKYTDESDPMGKYKGSGKLLWKAYYKYGFDNFEIEVLYRRIRDRNTVDAMEIWAIKKYKPEYNIAAGGTGGRTMEHPWNYHKKGSQVAWNKGKKGLRHQSVEERKRRSEYAKSHPNSGQFQKGRKSENKGKVYYYDPVNLISYLYLEGNQPEGWVRGRYTPWQGKWKNKNY